MVDLLPIAARAACPYFGNEMGSTMSTTEFSRRLVLQQFATAAGTVAMLGVSANHATAQAKLAKKDVDYQEQPKGNQRCDNCFNFEAPSGCKVVEGQVSPQGWCKAYAPKPS
jgi:hypothetical protein